jgi:acyl carrier protein
MGIDLLDIAFGIEKAFSIRLCPDDFRKELADGRLRGPTAGELFECIKARLSERIPLGPELRPTMSVRVRRLLADFAGAKVTSLHDDAPLEEVIPPELRAQAWKVLWCELKVALPRLRRPAWSEALIAGGLAWSACTLALGALSCGWSPPVFASAVAGLAFSARAWFTTAHARVRLPPSCRTLRAIVDQVLRQSYAQSAATGEHWHEEEAWSVLQGILVDALGVKPEQVTRDAHLVEDLGAN